MLPKFSVLVTMSLKEIFIIHICFPNWNSEDHMTTNTEAIGRILRASPGLALMDLAVFGGLTKFSVPLNKYGALAAGFVMPLIATPSFCPVYTLRGIKTCGVL